MLFFFDVSRRTRPIQSFCEERKWARESASSAEEIPEAGNELSVGVFERRFASCAGSNLLRAEESGGIRQGVREYADGSRTRRRRSRMARLRNGKLLDGNWHSGREILESAPGGRRVVQVRGGIVSGIDEKKRYSPEEIGRTIKTMPPRCKGDFFKPRSAESKRLIVEQIVDLSEKLFKGETEIDYDDINLDWMVVENYRMPPNWSVRYLPLMVLFPTEYPPWVSTCRKRWIHRTDISSTERTTRRTRYLFAKAGDGTARS